MIEMFDGKYLKINIKLRKKYQESFGKVDCVYFRRYSVSDGNPNFLINLVI